MMLFLMPRRFAPSFEQLITFKQETVKANTFFQIKQIIVTRKYLLFHLGLNF